MLGDIHEQYARGKSRIWLWQEVITALFTEAHRSILSGRTPTMKRTIIWTTALLGVFSLGYLTARSPFLIHEQMPSADVIAHMKQQWQLAEAHKRSIQGEGVAFFLKTEVKVAELEYDKSRTAASKAKLEALRSKLDQATSGIRP
jgi:hypothetical protein